MATKKTAVKKNSLANLKPAWKPGESGNPAGRSKGSRSRLSEAFLADMAADWQEHGKQAIQSVRQEDPSTYLRVAASLLPRQVDVTHSLLDDLRNATEEEIHAALREALEETGLVDSNPRRARGVVAGPGETGSTTH